VVPLSEDALGCMWTRTRIKAGCSDLRWHDLRHEAVSRLFEKGLKLPEVMAISGHTTTVMAMRYTHLMIDDLVAKLG
jgi:integrase